MSKFKWFGIPRLKRWQSLSLAFTTMLLVTLLSAGPSLTQQDSPERLKVIKKIEETATLHHQAKLKTEDGLKIARDEHKEEALKASLTKNQIQKFYLKKRASLNKSNPFQQWQPFGWLAAVVMGIITIFGKAINNRFIQIVQAIIDNLYKRFSGTQLFRDFALKRYRTALSNKYQELKIPFRPNRPLKMEEVYVPLQLLEQGEPIDAKQAVKNFKRLMIVGQPGSGKTMLLKSLALNYAKGPWNIPQQPVAIIFELNRLSDTKLTIEQQLVKVLERDDFPNGTNFVFQGLKQGMIMLLFDGLDEVNSKDRPNVVRRLQDFIDQYDQCRVAITCRTQVYKQEFDSQVEQTVEVVDFNDQQIRKFLRPWKQSMSADKSVEQLLQALQDRPRIMELARNPLMLTIIAYLYTDTAFVLPHSRAEFYQKATDILLETWDEFRQTPNRYKGRDKKLVLRHLALYGQDQTKGKQQDRRHLSWRDVNEQVASILPDLNLTAEDNLDPILAEICERSGLLMPIDGGEGYQFSHLTLQEFFAATQLIDDEKGLIERFEQDPDVWRETVKLWCGLAGDSTELIRSVYKKDRVAAFSCLADAQKIELKLATDIIDHFKGWLRGSQPTAKDLGLGTVSADSAIKAFGAVAADQRPRGKDVFNFLVQILSERNKSTTYAAQALAATNISEAAQVLADHYLQQTDIQTHLVRMGDVAVPKLKNIAKDGYAIAFEHLGSIGTPFAIRTLVPLLWDDQEVVAFHAAVQLATLLPKTDIEKDLANFPRDQLPSSSQTWQGIWNPFDGERNSTISIIAEQIIDQLAQWIQVQSLDQMDLPDLDPRIVLPICILSNKDFCKPSKDWIVQTQTILENTGQGLPFEINSAKLIREALEKQHGSFQWEVLLGTLPLRTQLDLIYRLSANRLPTKNDWQNLYTKVSYDFRTSWHYQLVVAIAFLLSGMALIEAFATPILSSEVVLRWPSILFAFFTVPIFWIVLWQSTEQPLEPNLFFSLGLQGPITFCREYKRLLRNQIVWNGAQAIFKTITNTKNTLFIAIICATDIAAAVIVTGDFGSAVILAAVFALAGALIGAFVVAFVGSVTSDIARALGFTLAGDGAGDGALAGAVGGAFAGNVGFAFTFAFSGAGDSTFVGDVNVVYSGAFIGALIGALFGAFTGAGIGYWVSQTTNQNISRYLAILAAPFFCWMPVSIWFSTLFLHRFIGFSWPKITLVWLIIVSICTLLLRHGRQQEQLAQNPLKGILPDYDTAAH